MKIVADRGLDIVPEQIDPALVEFVPLKLTLDGVTYESGVNLTSEQFYTLLSKTDSAPTTSQPSVGEFAELYSKLASQGEEILSIHISSGLSGTFNSARAAAELVPEAKITFFDSKTLSSPYGWQVEAAVRAIRAGYPMKQIIEVLERVREKTEGMFTVATMKYLIHGGRIGHIKGLVATLLNIKPIISVQKKEGIYYELGKEITLKRAILREAELVTHWFAEGSAIRVQLIHGLNNEGIELLKNKLDSMFKVTWVPSVFLSPVLGAHTGPGLVGMAVGPADVMAGLP